MDTPDYHNSLVNLACSVLKHFGGEPRHETLPCLDVLLEKGYENIVVMLFDGLGTAVLADHLPEDSFLRRHYRQSLFSVFPPTTTAATVSIETGLTPAQHGWLGWSLYFKEINETVNLFPNTIQGKGSQQAATYHVARRYLPYQNLFEIINSAGVGKAYYVSPFGTHQVSKHGEIYGTVQRLCREEGPKYIYTYWDQPDAIMHDTGCQSSQTGNLIREINRRVEKMAKGLENTLVIVTADHGHLDVRYEFVSDHPALQALLLRPIAMESRAAAFYVKPGCESQFEQAFYQAFGEQFYLLSKREVLERKLFGGGTAHPRLEELMGDYLAIALTDASLAQDRKTHLFRSHHAGLTKREMQVPLIVIEKGGEEREKYQRLFGFLKRLMG